MAFGKPGIPREQILAMAARPFGFRVSWRYRDDALRRRCKRLRREGLLAQQKGRGEDVFYAVAPQPTAQRDPAGR